MTHMHLPKMIAKDSEVQARFILVVWVYAVFRPLAVAKFKFDVQYDDESFNKREYIVHLAVSSLSCAI